MKKNSTTTTTPHQPESTPRLPGQPDNWVLHELSEARGDIKALTQTIAHLSEKIEKLDSGVDGLKDKVGGIDKIIYAATSIIVLVVGVGAYVADKAIDFGLDMARDSKGSTTITTPSQNNPKP